MTIFGFTLQLPVQALSYPMLHTFPVPYVQGVYELFTHLQQYVSFDSSIHCPCDLASYSFLLLFCTSTANKSKLASLIPFVGLLPMQVDFAIWKSLL